MQPFLARPVPQEDSIELRGGRPGAVGRGHSTVGGEPSLDIHVIITLCAHA